MKKGLIRGLAGITASLCAVALVAAPYAGNQSAFINARLGTVSSRIETEDAGEDSYHFKSEFSSLEELVNAKKELAQQIAADGAVLLKNNDSALPLAAGAGRRYRLLVHRPSRKVPRGPGARPARGLFRRRADRGGGGNAAARPGR